MNKLEEIHKNIVKYEEPFIGFYHEHQVDIESIIKKSAEITTDVAVKFGEFLCTYPDKNRNVHGEILHAKSKYDDADTTKNLFDEFINNHYGK